MHSKCTYLIAFLQDLIRPHSSSLKHAISQWEQGAQSLLMKMRNAEFYLKGATVISLSGSRLQQDYLN